MPNKDRQKRSVRKARARERAEVEAQQQLQAAATQDAKGKAVSKAQAPKKDNKPAKAKKNKKPGLFKRMGNYFAAVGKEMNRVVWPSRTELKNYSIAVIVALVVFGVCVWAVDTGFVAVLVGFTGLRG